jgi:hypothetical protein
LPAWLLFFAVLRLECEVVFFMGGNIENSPPGRGGEAWGGNIGLVWGLSYCKSGATIKDSNV